MTYQSVPTEYSAADGSAPWFGTIMISSKEYSEGRNTLEFPVSIQSIS